MARAKKTDAPEVDPGVVPTNDFAFVYRHQLLSFKTGVVFYPDAQLLAALHAANAPLKD